VHAVASTRQQEASAFASVIAPGSYYDCRPADNRTADLPPAYYLPGKGLSGGSLIGSSPIRVLGSTFLAAGESHATSTTSCDAGSRLFAERSLSQPCASGGGGGATTAGPASSFAERLSSIAPRKLAAINTPPTITPRSILPLSSSAQVTGAWPGRKDVRIENTTRSVTCPLGLILRSKAAKALSTRLAKGVTFAGGNETKSAMSMNPGAAGGFSHVLVAVVLRQRNSH
jgi:hypothetical protein